MYFYPIKSEVFKHNTMNSYSYSIYQKLCHQSVDIPSPPLLFDRTMRSSASAIRFLLTHSPEIKICTTMMPIYPIFRTHREGVVPDEAWPLSEYCNPTSPSSSCFPANQRC